jgi:hypothetical protein
MMPSNRGALASLVEDRREHFAESLASSVLPVSEWPIVSSKRYHRDKEDLELPGYLRYRFPRTALRMLASRMFREAPEALAIHLK